MHLTTKKTKAVAYFIDTYSDNLVSLNQLQNKHTAD